MEKLGLGTPSSDDPGGPVDPADHIISEEDCHILKHFKSQIFDTYRGEIITNEEANERSAIRPVDQND